MEFTNYGAEEDDNIWIASSNGDLNRVKYLIEVDHQLVNLQDEHGYSPIHAASSYGHLDLLQYLISVGADVNLLDTDNDTPVLVCEDVNTLEYLISVGSNPLVKNVKGEGLIEKAMDDANEPILRFLVEKGYIQDPNFRIPNFSQLEEENDDNDNDNDDDEDNNDDDNNDDENEEYHEMNS